MPAGTLAATMAVTVRDIDALWGPATPQFAYQIADRLRDMIADCRPRTPVWAYGERGFEALDHLAQGTTKGAEPAH